MANYQYMMSADDVAKELDCSKSYAYKLVKAMNKELAEQGYITMAGRIPRAYWAKKMLRIRAGCEHKRGEERNGLQRKRHEEMDCQWFETNAKGEKKNEEREDFPQKRKLWNMSDRKNSIAVEVWI